jgi:predicted Rossmann-fold nucleotide-binding protein
MITAPTKAFVFFPGGFGTLHQLFEILTLIQTKKIKKRPVVLFDHAYWEPLHAFIKEVLVHRVATIDDRDDELYQIVDDPESAFRLIEATG